MLKWITVSDTNLTIVSRHRWSRKLTKVDKYLKLSARTAVFISGRGRLTPVLADAARGETGSRGGGGPVKLSDVYTWELAGFQN